MISAPFRVHVEQLGTGYLAENRTLSISVGGASAADAAEKARGVALELFRWHLREALPTTLMARIDGGHCVAFVMRPFDKPFTLAGGDPETLYVDSTCSATNHS
jgi:hypothetical protein